MHDHHLGRSFVRYESPMRRWTVPGGNVGYAQGAAVPIGTVSGVGPSSVADTRRAIRLEMVARWRSRPSPPQSPSPNTRISPGIIHEKNPVARRTQSMSETTAIRSQVWRWRTPSSTSSWRASQMVAESSPHERGGQPRERARAPRRPARCAAEARPRLDSPAA